MLEQEGDEQPGRARREGRERMEKEGAEESSRPCEQGTVLTTSRSQALTGLAAITLQQTAMMSKSSILEMQRLDGGMMGGL